MSALRTHNYNSLPAPVPRANSMVSQSKSHVLAGVQDAYWSDDDGEDAECPLCLEEMDISDLNFKPCICGYQICRFCWHHIKENLNKRCPACRRVYTDEAVEFKPIPTQDHKRLTQQKKQRERERKELDILGRRHLANVRIVQRNVVYILGIGPRFAKEELIPTLRSNEYFGQYGKITKILLVKRTPSGGGNAVVGLYITYQRKEDAARCISSVDGTASPSGGREVVRASYGTTKYCITFLRGASCSDNGCMNLHEWGDEKDCFTKEDLTTLKHTMKATENRTRSASTSAKKSSETDANLVRGSGLAQGSHITSSSNTLSSTGVQRQSRRGAAARQHRSSNTTPFPNDNRSVRTHVQDLKHFLPAKSSVQASPRPTSPSISAQLMPEPLSEPRSRDVRKKIPHSAVSQSPARSSTADSDMEPSSQCARTSSVDRGATPAGPIQASGANLALPPGLPVSIPDLSTPPGLPPAIRPTRAATSSPQTPLLASQTSYQMSNAARALVDDVKARRESATQSVEVLSPFPDFDRTLQTLSGSENGGFSFNLDPKLAVNEGGNPPMSDLDGEIIIPFVDTISALHSSSSFTPPPGLPYPHRSNHLGYNTFSTRFPAVVGSERGSPSSNYVGSFDPFAEGNEEPSGPSDSRSSPLTVDDDCSPKVSRFRFARRHGSSSSFPVSPWPGNFDVSAHDSNDTRTPSEKSVSVDHENIQRTVTVTSHYPHSSITSSTSSAQPQTFGVNITEAQLRDFIQASKDRVLTTACTGHSSPAPTSAKFTDPAILSAPTSFTSLPSVSYGAPPGLPFPLAGTTAISTNDHSANRTENNSSSLVRPTTQPAPSPTLSPSDFPALIPSTNGPHHLRSSSTTINAFPKLQGKAERKVTKRLIVTEISTGRQKVAQEEPVIKEVENEQAVQKRAVEKKIVVLKTPDQSVGAASKPKKLGKDQLLQQGPSFASDNNEQDAPKRVTTSENGLIQLGKSLRPNSATKLSFSPAEPAPQDPILSKKPKKVKPLVRPVIKVTKEVPLFDDPPNTPSLSSTSVVLPTDLNSNDMELDSSLPTPLVELLEEIDICNPEMDLCNHPFFDSHKLNPAAGMPLEYGPLVHALSALSVGGGSFANSMPSGSIDNAVSSFQQLLETLTQTISDLLRLLPRTTWDDSSSFDGVLRDMLKGDDFLDDSGYENRDKEDEVQALTLALERRAKWMEVQLSKLEELHRDINTAAVRAVLSFNDNGWDRLALLPRTGNSLRRFDNIGLVEEGGVIRPMTSAELEEKLAVAQEAALFAESQVRELMVKVQYERPTNI